MQTISTNIEANIAVLEKLFTDCGDVVKRKFSVGSRTSNVLYMIYLDNLVDRDTIERRIIEPIVRSGWRGEDAGNLNMLEYLSNGGITTVDFSQTQDFAEMVDAVLSGDTALFVDGYSGGLVVSTKGWPNRGVQSAETEVVVQGSKEAFSETFRINTVLIRRRIRDTRLKLKQMYIGERSKTSVGIMYMDDIVRHDILEELEKRLNSIEIDALLDVGYVEQMTADDWLSPFPQYQTTERPDKAAAAILEGRIVVVVDNSPFVLILPTTLNSMMQAAEDYYQGWEMMSATRILRYMAVFMGLSLPALYIAIAVYHPSMLPTLLIHKLAEARRDVPFPATLEIILMDFAFELLREAGVRLPSAIGGTIGIVGGLIIGQAAVEAGLVSPIVVIVVAVTGISTFVIPSFRLVNGFRLMKYVLIFFASILGLFGFWIGFLIVLLHLSALKSYGIPYMFPYVAGEVNRYADYKDTIVRAPLFMMKKPPLFANPLSGKRLQGRHNGKVRSKE
ncbi:MAG: spore germination protein [Defluviitaleaceae bacterium]|nr:spore germination protein [Defluviitaleaceae bacterium]